MIFKKKSPMLFQKLSIEKETYGSNAGKILGKASFRNSNSDITINLTEEHAQKIIDMCADALLDAAKDMSEVMRGDIIEAMSFTDTKRIK